MSLANCFSTCSFSRRPGGNIAPQNREDLPCQLCSFIDLAIEWPPYNLLQGVQNRPIIRVLNPPASNLLGARQASGNRNAATSGKYEQSQKFGRSSEEWEGIPFIGQSTASANSDASIKGLHTWACFENLRAILGLSEVWRKLLLLLLRKRTGKIKSTFQL